MHVNDTYNQSAKPNETSGSAYPCAARQLAKQWGKRSASRGLRGLCGASVRAIHKHYIRIRIDQKRPDIRFVILLSSMRCGSSMLTQIICSHDEVVGFGETHINYDSDDSFVELIRRTKWERRQWRFSATRFFDKVLHAELIENMELLSEMPVDWIVLHRSGEACVRSMMRTFSMTPEHASEYFARQWSVIDNWVKYLEGNPDSRITAIGYEDIISNPDEALTKLSDYLGIRPALRSEYTIQRGAGRSGAGDPSGQLEHGRVVKTDHVLDPEIDPDILQRLQAVDAKNRALVDRIAMR
jgi:Sulfotransferase domain